MTLREDDHICTQKQYCKSMKLSGPGMLQPVMPFWPDRKIGVVLCLPGNAMVSLNGLQSLGAQCQSGHDLLGDGSVLKHVQDGKPPTNSGRQRASTKPISMVFGACVDALSSSQCQLC